MRFDAANDDGSIAKLRKRHLAAFEDLSCKCFRSRRSGLVLLGRAALDGSKVRANASRHKLMVVRNAHRPRRLDRHPPYPLG
jgi:hypothetical protein